MSNWSPASTTGLALAMDLLAGEPPESMHPVCWMGKAVSLTESLARRAAAAAGGGPTALRLAGAATAVALPVSVFMLARTALERLPVRWRGPAAAGLLYTTLAARSLGSTAHSVDTGLGADVKNGREAVSGMVGRDTATLDEHGVARAAVESVAENTNDGVVAPIFYGFIGGAPLALAYKMVNTLDSMIGYRNSRYRDYGWAAARLDDLAGYLPARLTAIAAAVASPALGADPRQALRVWRRDSGGHASPNAGVCESAFAGALGVRLGGANTYGGVVQGAAALGEGLRRPGRGDIGRAVSLMYAATGVVAATGSAVSWTLRKLFSGAKSRA